MKRKSSDRNVVQCASLEARRLFCADGWRPGESAAALSQGTDEPPHAHAPASAGGGIDTLVVPAYSSRPASPWKVYLDFNGHGAIDNWNGWWEFGGRNATATPAYDIDGDTDTWSNQELANIQQIWKGVVEKFSPFHLDVTTVEPPSNESGVRVVIGGDGAWVGRGGGIGATFGFGSGGAGRHGNVAFVWANQDNPTYVAEAITHEAGHTLGLRHHSYNPIDLYEYAAGFIMGRGDFGVGRWTNTSVSSTVATRNDDGDVVVAGNGTQDDLNLIVNGNGFSYRPDDVGGVIGNATFLPMSLESGVLEAAGAGVIERESDVDMFRINHTGGSLLIDALPAEFRRMLDPRLALHNATGAVVAASTNNSGGQLVGERIDLDTLAAGTYYIAVHGGGTYGDLGQYRLNISGGLDATASNNTLGTATALGIFGQTDNGSVALGFGGTAQLTDTLTAADQYDFFKIRTPKNTNQLYVRLSGQTTSVSLAVYDDLNGNGTVEVGEIIYAANPSTQLQSVTYNAAASGKTYYIRAGRASAAPAGTYALRITVDAAPATLPGSVPAASFDPQPLVGAKIVYDSIDAATADSVDYFRATAERPGLFAFYLFNYGSGDVRLDVGSDFSGNGLLESNEILASGAEPGSGGEYIQNLSVTANQKLLVRVTPQVAGQSSNYQLQAVADYAFGGNNDGSLANARDLTNMAAGSVLEYLDGRVDFFDTFRIAPPPGLLEAQQRTFYTGLPHRVEIIRDGNANQVVDPGEVVASGTVSGISHNVTPGANYYLRVRTQLAGEFPTIGQYSLLYTTAGALNGSTVAAPTPITPSPILSTVGGYVGFNPDPILAVLTNTEDYYRFTLATRTRFDVSINAPGMGVQVGQLDGNGIFRRLGGVGANQGFLNSLNVNLDPGTYLVRAYLPVPERHEEPLGGNYALSFKTAVITDNAPPLVTNSSFQYEIAPTGVSFTMDQDVAGSIDVSDVVVRNLATNTMYPMGGTFYDQATRRIGYALADGVLPDGNYRATLLAGSLRDASANPLAADHSFDFFVLAGDANRDRRVNLSDFNTLAANFGQTNRTFSQGDFSYDGQVNLADFNVLASNFGQSVAAGADGLGGDDADAGDDGSKADLRKRLGELLN